MFQWVLQVLQKAGLPDPQLVRLNKMVFQLQCAFERMALVKEYRCAWCRLTAFLYLPCLYRLGLTLCVCVCMQIYASCGNLSALAGCT